MPIYYAKSYDFIIKRPVCAKSVDFFKLVDIEQDIVER